MQWQKLVVLWIKFPISPITHLHSTNYSSMVDATNTVTIAPYILIPTGIKYGRCDAQMTFNSYVHSINWISLRENCNCLGEVQVSLFFFVKSQDLKGQMKFKWTPDIPVIAGDGLAYGVACLQFLDSSLEVWHVVIGKFYWKSIFLSNVKFC